VSGERAAASEHLVEHATECPDVGALVGWTPFGLLRGHVCGGAEDDPCLRGSKRERGRVCRVGDARDSSGWSFQLRESEIENLHSIRRSERDVGGFEIAMDDAAVVRCFERIGNLAGDGERFLEWNRPAGDSLRKRFAIHELEYEKLRAAGFFEAMDA